MSVKNGDIAASIISIILFVFVMIFPIITGLIIYTNRDILGDKLFYQRYGSFYQDIKPNSIGVYYCLLFMIRRIVYGLISVALGDYPAF